MCSARLIGAGIVGIATCTQAAIIPSWRQNPISAAAIADVPTLQNAISISLVVTLTGDSLFNVAGLDLTNVLPGVHYYHHPLGSNPPNPVLIPLSPALEFDTYVTNTDRSSTTIPGRYNGTGAALLTEDSFNVAWGATPNTGPLGGTNLEIARITILGQPFLPPFNIPLSAGQIRDSVNPNMAVAIPAFPEPAGAVPLLAGATVLRRGRRERIGRQKDAIEPLKTGPTEC